MSELVTAEGDMLLVTVDASSLALTTSCSRKATFAWPKEMTLALIGLYKSHEHLFNKVNIKKKSVWELICNRIKQMGFEGSEELQWTNCEGKWKSLTAAYRKTVDHNNRTGSDRRECAFFNELSDVYGYRPTVHPVATSSSTGKGDSKSVQTRERDGDNTSPSPDDPSTPSTSGVNLSTPSKKRVHAQDDSGTPKLKRRRKSTDEMVLWLEEYKKEKAVQEEHRLKEVKEMHKQQMELLGGFLEVLKDMKK